MKKTTESKFLTTVIETCLFFIGMYLLLQGAKFVDKITSERFAHNRAIKEEIIRKRDSLRVFNSFSRDYKNGSTKTSR